MRTRLSLHRDSSWSSWFSRSRATDDGQAPSSHGGLGTASVVGVVPRIAVDGTAIEPAQTTSTENMADPRMGRRRWRTGRTGNAVGGALHHLVAASARAWGRMPRVERTRLQIGSGLAVEVVDMRGYLESAAVALMRSNGLTPGRRGEDHAAGVEAGHIVRTRPSTGSFVPMGTTIDYVVASSMSPHRDAPAGDSTLLDHDAIAHSGPGAS